MFGTPMTQDDLEPDQELSQALIEDDQPKPPISVKHTRRCPIKTNCSVVAETNRKLEACVSPAKSILLTPGAGTSRRKTVTFGKLIEPDSETLHVEKSKVTMIVGSGKDISTQHSTVRSDKNLQHQNRLRRSLFAPTNLPAATLASRPHFNSTSNPPEDRKKESNDGQMEWSTGTAQESPLQRDGDVTIDLKDPRSKSGKFWKEEHENYQHKSDCEIRSLIRYGQVTKSYAEKKDSEAMNLREKLDDAVRSVAKMEARVSILASQLACSRTDDGPGDVDQARILSDLARQTATALKYKEKAENYKLLIAEQKGVVPTDIDPNDHQEVMLGLTEPTIQQTSMNVSQELQTLRSEVTSLRATAEKAKTKATGLERDNKVLKTSLARVKKEMKEYEIRNQAREERRKRKDKRYDELKRQLAERKTEHERRSDLEGVEDEIITMRNYKPLATLPNVQPQILTSPSLASGANSNREWLLMNAGDGQLRSPKHLSPATGLKQPSQKSKHRGQSFEDEKKSDGQTRIYIEQPKPFQRNTQDDFKTWTNGPPKFSATGPIKERGEPVSAPLLAKNEVHSGALDVGTVLFEVNPNAEQQVHKYRDTSLISSFMAPSLHKPANKSINAAKSLPAQLLRGKIGDLSDENQPLKSSLYKSLNLPQAISSRPSNPLGSNPPSPLSIARLIQPARSGSQHHAGSTYPSSRLSSLSGRPPVPPDRAATAKLRLLQKNTRKRRLDMSLKEQGHV